MPHPKFNNGLVRFYQADAREIPLKDGTVHCVVTSPPYFGLRVYKDNDDRGIGLESTMEEYIANLVEVFREVRRVLRDDGVCWVNLGDSYGQNTGAGFNGNKRLDEANRDTAVTNPSGPGNRLGIPERVALALQADGWVWRDTIIWAKKSAMPESLAGWRWERCRVNIEHRAKASGNQQWSAETGQSMRAGGVPISPAQWADCPGCPKCEDNDGLVLRKGSWRCTSAHEYIYMLTKGMGYYADGEAVKTALVGPLHSPGNTAVKDAGHLRNDFGTERMDAVWGSASGANRRSVWNDISPEPYGGSHFATFPSDLPRLCIQASTSEQGCCPKCGSQWARVVEVSQIHKANNVMPDKYAGGADGEKAGTWTAGVDEQTWKTSQTLGWRPSCGHTEAIERPDPALVLDPFMGTGTTALAAMRLGRRCVGTELSEDYLGQARKRLSEQSLPLPLVGTPSGHQEN